MSFQVELTMFLNTLKDELADITNKRQYLINRINQLEYIKTTKSINLIQLFEDLDYLRKKEKKPL